MNKRLLNNILFAGILLLVVSCKRYGDDPLTLRTPLNRITGTWEMTKYEIDGVDSLGLVDLPYTKMIFSKESAKKTKLRRLYADGYGDLLLWQFDDKKQKLEVSFTLFPLYGNDSFYPSYNYNKPQYYYWSWDIDKLTNMELILSTEAGVQDSVSRSYVIHMAKVSNKINNDF